MRNPVGLILIVASAVGTSAAAVLYFSWRRASEDSKWIQVATVDKLYLHPVKACRAMTVDSATVTEQGIMIHGAEIGDRSFMLIHENGRFATMRQFPRSVLIRPTVVGPETLQLAAPNMQPMEFDIPPHEPGKVAGYRVWKTISQGLDCGDAVAVWLQKFLGDDTVRLVFHNQRLPHREHFATVGFGHLGVYGKEPLKSKFHDSGPLNMVSQASLDLLNSKLDSNHQVTERWFRTNILLSGCCAFAEDSWKRIRIGSSEFVFAKRSHRCQVTTVDPETGVKDPERSTLKALSTFRMGKPEEKPIYGNSPLFCADYIVTKGGEVSVGDKVLMYSE